MTNRHHRVTLGVMMSNGNSFSEGNSYCGGKTTERECPFIARLLRPVEQRA